MPLNSIFLQIVVPQACPERPDPATELAGGVEIWALCEWRLAIACAVRRAPRAARWRRCDVDQRMPCHVMVDGMAWHGMLIGIPASAVRPYFYKSL